MTVECPGFQAYRRTAFALAPLALLVAGVLAATMRLRVDFSGFVMVGQVAAVPMLLGFFLRSPGRITAIGDVLSMLSVMLFMIFCCGAIAIMSTRSVAPLADGWLSRADGMIGLSATGFIAAISLAPPAVQFLLRCAYEYTGLWLILTLMVMPFIGQRRQAWRLLMLWNFTLICTSLISFAAPAYGSFAAMDPAVMDRLPGGAGVFAFDAFASFRFGVDPVVSINALGGVVCFPSFHTICALLLVQAWKDFQVIRGIAAVLCGATIVSTLPMGGHYFIDLFAGAGVWWLCTIIADKRVAGWSATLDTAMSALRGRIRETPRKTLEV